MELTRLEILLARPANLSLIEAAVCLISSAGATGFLGGVFAVAFTSAIFWERSFVFSTSCFAVVMFLFSGKAGEFINWIDNSGGVV